MMPGQILRQRYLLKEQIGKGGFGETYLAEYPQNLDTNPKLLCAVKRLTRTSTPELDTVERFKREAAILQKLGEGHDQIPKLIDYFEENQEFYIVQEFIEGHDLSDEIISGQQSSEAEVTQLLQEVLEILAYIHQHNVIHRDIKPQNLMRRYSDGKIVLIDFGVIKEIINRETNASGSNYSTIPIGTLGYTPIEQREGHPRLSSDIFALGVVAIQALTGVLPKQLKKDSNLDFIWRDRARISDNLAEILTKMTHYHFSQRYQNATEALQDLKNAINKTQTRFDEVCYCGSGLFSARIGNKWGLIDEKGNTIAQPQFDEMSRFNDGVAKVRLGSKWGFIEQTGRIIAQPQFTEVGNFSEGLAAVRVEMQRLRFFKIDQWGYIDLTGKMVIQPQFRRAMEFSEGLAVVTTNFTYQDGYIDRTGQIVIKPQFRWAYPFSNGQAKVKIDGQYRYVDKTGQFID